jgi:hypothetical protein
MRQRNRNGITLATDKIGRKARYYFQRYCDYLNLGLHWIGSLILAFFIFILAIIIAIWDWFWG